MIEAAEDWHRGIAADLLRPPKSRSTFQMRKGSGPHHNRKRKLSLLKTPNAYDTQAVGRRRSCCWKPRLSAVADLDQSSRRGIIFQVLTIRCTRKLLEHLRAEPCREPTRPTNRLGDWYANLVSTKRGTLVICVSERSLLPVFVAATRDCRSFIFAFQEAVRSVLRGIGAAPELVESEARETKQIAIGTTASRRVLGSLNDLAFLARLTVADDPQVELGALAVELAETPCSPLNYETPRSVSLALLRRVHS